MRGLFDALPPRPPAAPPADKGEARPLTVSELTARIRALLESRFGRVSVAGEITNLRQPASGHVYFTLKDEGAQISAVMWRSLALSLRFALKDGLAVAIHGEVTVYEPRGNYQIVVRRIEPSGMGALELAFRQLCEKLKREGLFDEGRKRPIPPLPRTIGIVTSPTGAAIRDMLRVIEQRFPRLTVLLCPARVQGEGAAAEIAAAIAAMNRRADVDVLIIGRGGGSLEDLWAFNEEPVARAVFASRLPVISAVGHEIDLTVSDLVADARAATPTAAAELVTRGWAEVEDRLARARGRLAQALLGRLESVRDRLARVRRSYAFRRPLEPLRRREQRLDELAQRLVLAQKTGLRHAAERVNGMAGRLDALNPLQVLARGYSITSTEGEARPLRDAAGLAAGARLRTRLHRGDITSIVEKT